MLYLIGLGLWDEKDISLRGLEAARDCDVLYLENYTSRLVGSDKEKLEKILGKQIQSVNRAFIESGEILNYAIKRSAGLLTAGDPMIATTHSDLLLRAKEKGIKTQIIHNASIFGAIAETGLQIYRFGKTATITFWEENYRPTSFYDAIAENQKRGLHTLMLLDLRAEENKFMNAAQGLKTLLEIAQEKGDSAVTPDTPAVVCAQLGSPKSKITYGTISQLMTADTGLPLQVIIIPAPALHEMEQKFLEQFRVK
ncbi:MAG: diphthine synthase [Candidatus Micrarchaeota archaeon]